LAPLGAKKFKKMAVKWPVLGQPFLGPFPERGISLEHPQNFSKKRVWVSSQKTPFTRGLFNRGGKEWGVK